MTQKIIIPEFVKNDIIQFLSEGYQITIPDIHNRFPDYSEHVIRRSLREWGVEDLLFTGIKDTTRLKLSLINTGKVTPEEVKQKQSASCKLAMSKRSSEEKSKSAKLGIETKIKNWGSWENYSEYQVQQSKITKKIRYDDENYNNQEKHKKTCFDRYGNENYNNKERIKMTQFELYGGYAFNDWDKVHATNYKKYGVEHNWSSKDPKLNGRETCYKKYNGKENFYRHTREQGKKTRLELYGDENYSNTEQAKQTCLERYHSESYLGSKEFNQNRSQYDKENVVKRYETMKKNGTLTSSKQEDQFYITLQSIFGEDNVIHGYTDKRYPFCCDFYIPSKDLFIECHFGWRHCGHPYDPTNEEDIALLEAMKSKVEEGSDNYVNAIYQWTDLDVRKQKISKENNLNYIAIYNEEQFYEYYDI